MDRGAWQATVYGVTRVGPSLATKNQQPIRYKEAMLPIYSMSFSETPRKGSELSSDR